jgi:hypothetical protein
MTELKSYSPLTYLVERIFHLLKEPASWLLKDRIEFQAFKEWDSERTAITTRRTNFVEIYICGWLLIEILSVVALIAFGHHPLVLWTARVLMVLRIIDIVQAAVNVNVLDQLRAPATHQVASVIRILVLSGVNLIELIVSFGSLYLSFIHLISGATHWADAFYFSAITQLTVGFGDISPVGAPRQIFLDRIVV